MFRLIRWARRLVHNEEDNSDPKEIAEDELTSSPSTVKQWADELCTLPDLAVLRVLHHVPLADLLDGGSNVNQVCRQWHRLCVEYTNTQVRSLNLLVGPSPRTSQIYAAVLGIPMMPVTRSLTMANPVTKGDRLRRLSTRLKGLTSLVMYQRDECLTATWVSAIATALGANSPWHSGLVKLHFVICDRPTRNGRRGVQRYRKSVIELLDVISTMTSLRNLELIISHGLCLNEEPTIRSALVKAVITSGIQTLELGSLDPNDQVVNELSKHYNNRKDSNHLQRLKLMGVLEQIVTIRRIIEHPALASTVTLLVLSKHATERLATAWPALLTLSQLSVFSALMQLRLTVDGDQCLRRLSVLLSHLPSLVMVDITLDLTSYVIDNGDDSQWTSVPRVRIMRLFVDNLDPITGLNHTTPPALTLSSIFTGVNQCELQCRQCVPCGYTECQGYALNRPIHFVETINRCQSRLMYSFSSALPMVTVKIW